MDKGSGFTVYGSVDKGLDCIADSACPTWQAPCGPSTHDRQCSAHLPRGPPAPPPYPFPPLDPHLIRGHLVVRCQGFQQGVLCQGFQQRVLCQGFEQGDALQEADELAARPRLRHPLAAGLHIQLTPVVDILACQGVWGGRIFEF